MEQNIISMREMQRGYKRLLLKAKAEKKPVFLGSYGKLQAVLLGIDEFEKLKDESKTAKAKMKWQEMKAVLNRIAAKGVQNISLAEFVAKDRHAH